MKRMQSITGRFLAAVALILSTAQLSHAQPPQPPAGEAGRDVPAFARMPPAMMQRGPHLMGPPFLRHLQLSEEQQDRIFEILHKQAPAQRNSEKLLHKSLAALHALGFSSSYNDATAQSLSKSVGQASTELALLRTRTDRQILAVLTPEQRKQLSERPMPPARRPGEEAMPRP